MVVDNLLDYAKLLLDKLEYLLQSLPKEIVCCMPWLIWKELRKMLA